MNPDTHITRVIELIHRTVKEGYNDPAIRAEERAMVAEFGALPDAEKDRLAAAWKPLFADSSAEPDAWRRAAMGRLMALIGRDDRRGIGLGADGLPDIEWIKVPAGEFIYQEGERLTLPTFYISRYPLTYTQYQPFLDAEDGFCDPRWWADLPDEPSRHRVQSAPQAPSFPLANMPRDEVSWYELMAFSRWLSHRWGGSYDLDGVMEWKARLPSEQEWEKAARGTDGRRYPWGDEYIEGYANIDEVADRAHLKGEAKVGTHFFNGPTAVGLYPQGASPYGLLDMIGNMWEITLTDYRSGKHDDLRDPYVARVQRGGPWFVQVTLAHNMVRSYQMMSGRGFDVGFRLAASSV